jgi:hypothetical protein
MWLKNLATNTLIPTDVARTARTRGTAFAAGALRRSFRDRLAAELVTLPSPQCEVMCTP